MSATKLQTVLSNDAGVTSHVSNRIFLAPAAQGTARPYIAYEFDSDDPVKSLDGVASLQRQNWNVYVTADSFSSADTVKMAVINALNDESTEFNALFQSSDHNFDDGADTHTFELNFTLTYQG